MATVSCFTSRSIKEQEKINELSDDKELVYLQSLYEKLKDFYAQPKDGYWPLRPKWVPDISKWIMYKSPYREGPAMKTKFRRFSFEEFCKIFEMEKWNGTRERKSKREAEV